ncbi:Very-long-chain 3-oxoacyl-CoA reductase [Triplophysa tibetana]|uniref:Very-long-chain 3-oxoacyl-CoA reductase n=1 Tax=Triplophysa tibetana TaxID=1572043 RepID=A0A5A9P9C5_9TELE|nr:Very-long-chain 3-oxoacyl-CoA reductase [Triplophysa tibetana]
MSEIWQTDLKAYGQWAAFMNNWRTIGVLDNRQVIQQGPPLAGQMSVVKQPGGKLAKRGLDLVLISRSEEKLHRVAKDIESQFRRQTRVIQADFTEGHSIYSAITQQLEGLEIGILVNNVGMNYTGILANFLDVPDPEQRITQVINCNILSVTQMSRLILPGMVERGKGLIINMSSEAASQPQPMLSLYSATKCVAPFVVSTNMTHNVPVNPLVKSAASFARDALNTVGYTSYTSGCVTHALQRMAKLALNTEPQIRERMANNKQD